MYQFRDKKQIAKRKIIIRNIFIIGFVLVVVFLFSNYFSKILNLVGIPLWSTENKIVNIVEYNSHLVRTKSSVFRENDNLIEKNKNLESKMIDYEILKKENDELKEMLIRLPSTHNFTLATILAKPNQSPYDTIIVDVGSDEGITEGLKVYANGETPIGQVEKVYMKTSLITLYSNPKRVTQAVLNSSNAPVELIGRGGGNFEMLIPLDLSSENGELVVLPGLTSEVIAIVDGVISTPTDPIKKVILRSPINIQSLKWVEIKRN